MGAGDGYDTKVVLTYCSITLKGLTNEIAKPQMTFQFGNLSGPVDKYLYVILWPSKCKHYLHLI